MTYRSPEPIEFALVFTNALLLCGILCLVSGILALVIQRFRRKREQVSALPGRDWVTHLLITAGICTALPLGLLAGGFPSLTDSTYADGRTIEIPEFQKAQIARAIERDDVRRVRRLLEKNPDLIYTQWWNSGDPIELLRLAVECRAAQTTEYLLTHDLGPDGPFDYWLTYKSLDCAIGCLPYQRSGEVNEIIYTLLTHGADVNGAPRSIDREPTDTPLHSYVRAIIADHYADEEEIALLHHLIVLGADLDAEGAGGLTPIKMYRKLVYTGEYTIKEYNQMMIFHEMLDPEAYPKEP